MKAYSLFNQLFVVFILTAFIITTPLCLIGQLRNFDAHGRRPIIASRVQMTLDYSEATLRSTDESAIAALPAILPPAFDLAAAVIGQVTRNAAKKYESLFAVSAAGSGFWISGNQVRLPLLTISRMVMPRNKIKFEEALRIVLRPELSADRTAFRLVPDSAILFRATSVKTKGRYDHIDLEITIRFRSLTVVEGKYKLVDLRNTSVSLPALTPGDTLIVSAATISAKSGSAASGWLASGSAAGIPSSGWIPFPPMPSFEVATEAASEVWKTVESRGTHNGKPENDTLTTLTRIITANTPGIEVIGTNGGLYEFEVIVREINPYKIRVTDREQLIGKTGTKLADLLTAAVEE